MSFFLLLLGLREVSVDEVHCLDEATFFQPFSHLYALFRSPRDQLLVKVAMRLFELVFVEFIDLAYVPEVLPDVTNAG